MIIAIDAMGGDYAPTEIVKGAVLGSAQYNIPIILVGDQDAIKHCIPPEHMGSKLITIQHAGDVIKMDEHAAAMRTRTDASIVVAAKLVKQGEADALIGFGNTAATMATATLTFGRIKGIDRPPIASVWPGRNGPTMLLDVGAVVDCEINNLVEFALMGSAYMEKVLHVPSPRVAVLSIGEEKTKGNKLVQDIHEPLEKLSLNFIGNVESRHIFANMADVIVADGFAGNLILKFAEGIIEELKYRIKNDLRSHPLSYIPIILLLPLLMRLKKSFDYSEYGGGPLLGLNHICVIGHGRSKAKAMTSAIRTAKEAVENNLVQTIRDAVESAQLSQ